MDIDYINWRRSTIFGWNKYIKKLESWPFPWLWSYWWAGSGFSGSVFFVFLFNCTDKLSCKCIYILLLCFFPFFLLIFCLFFVFFNLPDIIFHFVVLVLMILCQLVQFSGNTPLLVNEVIPSERYTWMRILVNRDSTFILVERCNIYWLMTVWNT